MPKTYESKNDDNYKNGNPCRPDPSKTWAEMLFVLTLGWPFFSSTNGAQNVAKCCHLPELAMVLSTVFVIFKEAQM